MLLIPFTCNLLLTLAAPGAELSPASVAALHASFDPSLGSLRAGRVEAPAALGAQERSDLAAAQERSSPLAALRAGFEPTNDEWKWLAIGGGIILLIVLL
jgi:hypothetical protein